MLRALAELLRLWRGQRTLAEPPERPLWLRSADVVCVILLFAYLFAFVRTQAAGFSDPLLLEGDVVVQTLPAWRYHGTGLFPNDLNVDSRLAQAPPLWRLTYWVGTLVATPTAVSKAVPFLLLFLLLLWAYELGDHFGGPPLGAAVAALLVHDHEVWGRIVGGNPRAFGFPLLVLFLRCAVRRSERGVLLALLLQAAAYPSAFLFCAPAYGLTLLATRQRGPWLRFGGVCGLALGLMLWPGWSAGAQVGAPISERQLAASVHRNISGLWPLRPPALVLLQTLEAVFAPTGKPLMPALERLRGARGEGLSWGFLLALLLLAGPRLRRLPGIFPALLLGMVGVFALAYPLAYKLYLPERVLQYGVPVLVCCAGPALAALAFDWLGAQRAGLLAAGLWTALIFGVWGDGLPRRLLHMHRMDRFLTPTVRFCATLPREARIAAHLQPAAFIQSFALRPVLFAVWTNLPLYDKFNEEMERRLRDFYTAYYARDLQTVCRFAARYDLRYLIADRRDFATHGDLRAAVEPGAVDAWRGLAAQLYRENVAAGFALADPPAAAVVFRDRDEAVIDLTQLCGR